ncbi:MAG TPA: DUF72 domain-containing protein [Terriglobales bacterium]|nr:DUF72 domain-containing protein [Terriglobales bacterium]
MGEVLVGTAGWSYKDWEGVVYPPGLKREQHPVEYLAQFVDCIEINTSFYGHMRPEVVKLWCRKAASANRAFRFTAKLHKSFTHSPIAVVQPTSAETIRATEEDERLAKEGLDVLAGEGKLGALLAQFPVSFKNTNENRDWLETVIGKFHEYPLVIEVRHSSWNNEGILRYFAEKGVAFCNIDQPKLGLSLRPTEHVTAPVGYVRLHGRNYREWFESGNRDDRYNYLYTRDELEGWKERITRIAEKAEKTYAVTNNHFRGQAAVNAIQLKRMLGQPARAPETLVQEYPELRQYAEVLPS